MIRLMAIWPKSGEMSFLLYISTYTLSLSKPFVSNDSIDLESLNMLYELLVYSMFRSGDYDSLN